MSCKWVDGKAVCKTAMALLLELVSDGSAFALLSPKVTKAEWSASTQLWLRCGAFARILNMNQAIPDKDKHLKDKLYAEIPFILTMSVKSLNRLYEDGTFKESDESRECVESLHRSADSVKAFLDECVEQDEAGNVGRREMYEAYTEFCKREERSEHKKSIFFKYMEDKGYPAKRTANGFVYEGMKLINDGFIDITEDDELMQGCPFI